MASFRVTTTPQTYQSLSGDLDRDGIIFKGRLQNRGPLEAVFYIRAASQPNLDDAAFKKLPGEEWEMLIAGGDSDLYFWTIRDSATVVIESGS